MTSPDDTTVTKDSARMPSHSRFAHHLLPSSSSAMTPARRNDSATGTAALAGGRPSQARRPRAGIAALLPRLRMQPRAVCAAVGLVAIGVGAFSIATPAASAAEPTPWWHLTSRVMPSTLGPGATGTIGFRATNLGDESLSSCVEVAPGAGRYVDAECNEEATPGSGGFERTPLVLSVNLPSGIDVQPVSPGNPEPDVSINVFPEINLGSSFCSEPTSGQIRCVYEPSLLGPTFGPVIPFKFVEVSLAVTVASGSGGAARFEVSGGASEPASLQRQIVVGAGAPVFGVEEGGFSVVPEAVGGAVDAQAAGHPFQLTTTFALNQTADPLKPPALPRSLHFELPAGLLANASAFPGCGELAFLSEGPGNGFADKCSADSAIGVVQLTIREPSFGNAPTATYGVPVFNLTPKYGEPARFGFYFNGISVPIDFTIRSDGDYGATANIANITQISNFISETLTIWGAPGDPIHNASRGWACVMGGFYQLNGTPPCVPSTQTAPTPLLMLPTSCAAPFSTGVGGVAWPTVADPAGLGLEPREYSLEDAQGRAVAISGCNRVPFEPQIHAEPTSSAATSPTGLGFDIDVDDAGMENAKGLVQSQIKKAVVTLPEGFTTNPSVAEGLHACPQGSYESEDVDSTPGSGCPEDSKIGDVEIESPLVKPVVHGSLYVAKQGENPNGNNLLTIYMVAKNPEVGVIVKQALKVVPDPVTGQLTTEVDNIPQLPFNRFHLSFRQGQRSPLVTPPTCGTYTVAVELYPWSEPSVPVRDESSFQITQGPEGNPCPQGTPPFHPNLLAGSENPTAGAYSPFYTDITRKDSEQEITRFSIKLPTGMIAKLTGVSECSDAGIAAAKAREVEGGGGLEEASPSCPAGSLIGRSDVGSGVGNVLAYAPGKLYLAGPYHGSPISLVSITAAKVGPFDLGTVVVRFALDVNHETAEVSVDGAASDPIPHIVDGIPVHLRDIQAFVDRPNFTLNPTSCAKKSTASTVLGSGLNFASSSDDVPVTVSSPFQVASCASLGFAPKLALNLVGKKTHRGALPAFKAVLTYPKKGAYANIAAAQVTLPESEYLEQGHLKDVCTRKVFETGATPGENCPAKSIYGKARAVTPLLDAPLEGPVYLRTGYGTKLPELAAALNGPQISITLAGKIDSVHKKGTEGSRIRNTFSVVPDAPVEKFVLELKGGKKGLLVNSTDVCKGTHKALAAFTGQNGKLDEYEPALKAQCGKGKKKSADKKKGNGGK